MPARPRIDIHRSHRAKTEMHNEAHDAGLSFPRQFELKVRPKAWGALGHRKLIGQGISTTPVAQSEARLGQDKRGYICHNDAVSTNEKLSMSSCMVVTGLRIFSDFRDRVDRVVRSEDVHVAHPRTTPHTVDTDVSRPAQVCIASRVGPTLFREMAG